MSHADLNAVDWAATPLQAPRQWPPGLAAVVATMFGAPIPMALAVGERFVLVYNDAYAALLGAKHPAAFGRPAADALAENWDLPGHGDVVERVYRTGEPFYEPDTTLPVRRRTGGQRELVHFSRAYTAVRDDAGRIIAVLSVVSETSAVNRAMSGMAELTARLAAAVSVDSVAREGLAYAVDQLQADHARLVLADGPALRMARRARVDGADDTVDRLPPVWVSVPADARLPSATVTRSGSPLWLEARDLSTYPDLGDEPLSMQNLLRIGTVPLRTGTLRGAMSFGWESPGSFTAIERAALTAVGNVVAQSLARAQRFDEQREVADTLQLSMLPESLPQLPGIGMAARYVPSGPGASAGGDFYDAFEIAPGRFALVIGDVVGHGVQAATIMGQVRAAARVLAFRESDPVEVTAGLDPFVTGLGSEVFVTLLAGYVDHQSRRLRLVSAGHPLPILCRRGPDGSYAATPVQLPVGTPIGVAGGRAAAELELAGDDVLILYTDGVTEVPGEDPEVALQRLLSVAAQAAVTQDPRRICAAVLESRRATADDAAVLVLAVHEQRHLVAAAEFPAEATSPGAARRWARDTLAGWGAAEELVDSTLLGISELVSNSVLHARSGARVELDLDRSRLLALVSDQGTHVRPAPQSVDPTSSRGRGLTVVQSLADAWGVEQSGRGSTVWFEIARQPPVPADPSPSR